MKINNPLKMNDWNIRTFIVTVFAIQLSILGLIKLDYIGLHIPIIRQLIGFIYLSLIPGFLILRILKLHHIESIRSLLYAVGLSLSSLMFTGIFMNTLYPFFGIETPLSETCIIITMSILIIILSVICYFTDRQFSEQVLVDVGHLSLPLLLLLFIPFMSIFGTYLVNIHNVNILLIIMVASIGGIALFPIFEKSIPSKLYPFTIWIISISLIYHDTLISFYLNKYDVLAEYYFSSLVSSRSYWDFTISDNYNAMLSTTVMAPLFSKVCDLDLRWVYKIMYPLFFSFIPLGLYHVFQKRTNDTIAFLSSYYFVSLNSFYSVIPSLCKQLIAEFFFVLIIIVLFGETRPNHITQKLLLIIFSISIIISHYGISYLFMFSLFFSYIIIFIKRLSPIRKLLEKLNYKSWNLRIGKKNVHSMNVVSINFVILFTICAFAWYLYISNSSILTSFVQIGNHILSNLNAGFFNPESSRGMNSLVNIDSSYLHKMGKLVSMSVLFFIFIGMLKLVVNRTDKFETNYTIFSLYWFIICITAISISGFAVMNPNRLYHLSLFFLSPIAIWGGLIFFELLHVQKCRMMCFSEFSIKCLSIYFMIFFLFSSGFAYEVANDHPSSISLSRESIEKYGDITDKSRLINLMYEQNIFSAKWLSANMLEGGRVFATKGNGEGAGPLVHEKISPANIQHLNSYSTIKNEDYIYLSYINVVERIALDLDPKLGAPVPININSISYVLEENNKIYNNRCSQILIAD